MEIFKYGELEINYLKKKDKKLAEAIDRIGKIERRVIPDFFTALIIIYQMGKLLKSYHH